MNSKTAEDLFHGKEGYNCAQAILKTFQDKFDVNEATIVQASSKGGGRAEGGICGALYATHQLIDNEQTQQQINVDFRTKAGSIQCKEIRKQRKLSCKQCVILAAENISLLTK